MSAFPRLFATRELRRANRPVALLTIAFVDVVVASPLFAIVVAYREASPKFSIASAPTVASFIASVELVATNLPP